MTNMTNMGDLMDDMEAELLKKWRAVSAEQRAEEERQRQIQRDWEAAHTAFETEPDDDDVQWEDAE
jgi:hypothetical protein